MKTEEQRTDFSSMTFLTVATMWHRAQNMFLQRMTIHIYLLTLSFFPSNYSTKQIRGMLFQEKGLFSQVGKGALPLNLGNINAVLLQMGKKKLDVY